MNMSIYMKSCFLMTDTWSVKPMHRSCWSPDINHLIDDLPWFILIFIVALILWKVSSTFVMVLNFQNSPMSISQACSPNPKHVCVIHIQLVIWNPFLIPNSIHCFKAAELNWQWTALQSWSLCHRKTHSKCCFATMQSTHTCFMFSSLSEMFRREGCWSAQPFLALGYVPMSAMFFNQLANPSGSFLNSNLCTFCDAK